MTKEVKICLYPEEHKSKNGVFFEGFAQELLKNDGYIDLKSNLRFTGLEVDLMGRHRHKNEKVLVECKAKQKPHATEVKNFLFNVLTDKIADHGYFLHTEELTHDAAGLKERYQDNTEYNKKITFLGPVQIIENLVALNKIKKFDPGLISSEITIHKLILSYTYFGIYYIAVTYCSTEKKKFHVFDATNLNSLSLGFAMMDGENELDVLSNLRISIPELQNYEHKEIFNRTKILNDEKTETSLEISSSFKNFLNSTNSIFAHSKVDEIHLDDIFVYPDLKQLTYEDLEKKKLKNYYSLEEIIKSDFEYIGIFGDDVSGKSTCLKYAFTTLFNLDFLPIFLNGNLIKSNIRTTKLQSLLSERYREQYSTNQSFADVDDSKIVILIDDFHTSSNANSKSWENLLNNLSNCCGRIILSGEYTTLLKVGFSKNNSTKKRLFENFDLYKILELGPKLRYELIDRWYNLGEGSQYIDRNEILIKLDQARKHIKTLIGKNYVPSYPFYLLSALQALESGKIDSDKSSVYGYYYEFLIKGALIKSIKNPQEVGLYLNYLSYFAFFLFVEGQRKISLKSFEEFHEKFCKEIDYTLNKDSALKLLERSKLLTIEDYEVKFKEKFISYYFLANYLAQELSRSNDEKIVEVKSMISKMIQRVYRDEYAGIVMFLTHLSKDRFIIGELSRNAREIFEELDPANLGTDISEINSMLNHLPDQVLELIDAETKRREEIGEEDDNERIQKYTEKENSFITEDDNSLDEDINTIDFFARITLAFKTVDLLGQIVRAYWGELDSQEKFQLVKETYELGLRTLTSFLELFSENEEEIMDTVADHVMDQVTQKHIKDRYSLRKEVKENVRSYIFKMCFLASWGIITRVAHSIGNDKLKKTFEKVLEDMPTNATKLIDFAIKLDYETKISFSELKRLNEDLKKNYLSKMILQNIVINHLYKFSYQYKEKAKICDLMDITMKSQRYIDNTSKQKKS